MTEQPDTLAGKSNHHEWLSSQEIRSVEELETQSEGHHTIDRLEEIGERRRESTAHDALPRKDLKRTIVSQTNLRALSKATRGKLMNYGVKRMWAFKCE